MAAYGEGSNGDWDENRKFVLHAIEGIADDIKGMKGDVRSVRDQITALDLRFSGLAIRASAWGGLGGVVLGAIVYALARRFIG